MHNHQEPTVADQSQSPQSPDQDLSEVRAGGVSAPPERPVPREFRERLPAKSDDRIHVGDLAQALARLAEPPPVRPADPARQPPPSDRNKSLRKGETYWIVNPDDLDMPRRGRVVRLTTTPGKYVGVEFDEPVGPNVTHDCDGAGRHGHCLYCRVDQVLTNDEYKVWYERYRSLRADNPPLEDLDQLTLEVGPEGVRYK